MSVHCSDTEIILAPQATANYSKSHQQIQQNGTAEIRIKKGKTWTHQLRFHTTAHADRAKKYPPHATANVTKKSAELITIESCLQEQITPRHTSRD
ncbi:unnamed protein product, partial [Mesorhabditis spiculigera]